MISYRKFLKPHYVLTTVFIMQVVIYFFYVIGAMPSYRINFISTSIIGYAGMITFYFIPAFISRTGSTLERRDNLQITCTKPRRIFYVIYFYMAISLFGFLRLSSNLLGSYSMIDLIRMILTNRHYDYLVWGSGNTILSNFCIASLILLAVIFKWKERLHRITLFVNLLLLFIYASFLASRIIVLQGIVFFAVIFFRRTAYGKGTRISNVFIVAIVIAAFLVITSGFRDFEQVGKYYTNSKLSWGFSRITDYIISSTNTSLEYPSFMSNTPSSFPSGTLSLINVLLPKNEIGLNNDQLRMTVGAIEYTNGGAFAQIYSDYKEYFGSFMIILGGVYLWTWREFNKGNLFGLFVYPIIFYSLLESSRIFYIGTTMAEVLIILLVLTYYLCRSSFMTKDICIEQAAIE